MIAVEIEVWAQRSNFSQCELPSRSEFERNEAILCWQTFKRRNVCTTSGSEQSNSHGDFCHRRHNVPVGTREAKVTCFGPVRGTFCRFFAMRSVLLGVSAGLSQQ